MLLAGMRIYEHGIRQKSHYSILPRTTFSQKIGRSLKVPMADYHRYWCNKMTMANHLLVVDKLEM